MNELISQKTFNFFNGLTLLKYKPKVFYKNLWNTDPQLLEARGHVIDENGEYVSRPFKKVFNHKENNADIPKEQTIAAVQKINGFMLHVSHYRNNIGGLLVGTTGSLNSDFVELGENNLEKYDIDLLPESKDFTYIFEIVDNQVDPHIVNDDDGVYLIGVRNKKTGILKSQAECDEIAININAKRPAWKICTFKEILREVKDVNHEGFMIFDIENNDCILKIKSPYYLAKKWLMRRNADSVFENEYKTMVDEEYYDAVEIIRKYYIKDVWHNINEQDKGKIFVKVLEELRSDYS